MMLARICTLAGLYNGCSVLGQARADDQMRCEKTMACRLQPCERSITPHYAQTGLIDVFDGVAAAKLHAPLEL